MVKQVAILGSTGSIGTQALEVIEANSQLFSVYLLTANNNAQLLIKQAIKFNPKIVVIANTDKYKEVKEALTPLRIEVYSGENALSSHVTDANIDLVIAAMVGYAGLLPVISAIGAGKQVALANKETLVVAGDIISRLCEEKGVKLLPVDSEHSAIFQCLEGENGATVEKIILTCSGGPFRGFSRQQLSSVTKQQALAHPNWDMGNKITIDSATLMNKGFEVIEARWLFNLPAEKIDVVVHPQSIIHSLVQFEDGSIKAQLGLPDMRLPIQYAMCYPKRMKNNFPRFNFANYPQLNFFTPDLVNFRNLALAYHALEKGGNLACVLNAANEVVVDAFLNMQIGFLKMSDIIEQTMNKISYIAHPTISDYVETDKEARSYTKEFISKII
jgi:1-deoxy-D-xylulose-5-phosphate reductoisomerase